MRRIRRLLAGFAVVVAGWAAVWIAASERGARCNPDDLTGCDTLGSILLWLFFGLPVLLFAMLILLVLDVLTLRGRRSRLRREHRDE